MQLKLKGRNLYTETGALYAEIRGWRSRTDHRNTRFSVMYADGRQEGGHWCYFRDVVRDVRSHATRNAEH
jgi:hypothetical protein